MVCFYYHYKITDLSAITSSSTRISQQNTQLAGSEDKAQLVYTDINRDRGEEGQEDVLGGTSLEGKTRSRLGGQLLTEGGIYICRNSVGIMEKLGRDYS